MENATILANLKNKVYTLFFAERKFLNGITLYQSWSQRAKRPSKNSFSFVQIDNNTPKDVAIAEEIKTLDTIFKFKNQALFEKKFIQAVGGSGQEWLEIATLNSSSLLALLCFYNIDSKPLVYTMPDGTKCEFTHSYFECQNNIDGGTMPSNIDIVLTGEDVETKKSVIVFLESKFSEYLSGGKKDISNIYSEIFRDLNIKGLQFVPNNRKWTIESAQRPYPYCEGIKQMITHFCGVRDAIKRGNFGRKGSDSYLNSDFSKIYLGEILFEFDCDKKNENCRLTSYQKIYGSLVEHLESLPSKDNRLTILPTVLTYQQVFSENFSLLDENVREFYAL